MTTSTSETEVTGAPRSRSAAPGGPRAALLAAGHRLVAEHGRGFTTHQLVKEAGVALQTFYRQFGGKDRLLVALIAEQIRDHCARLVAAAEGITDPIARLDRHIRTTLTPLRTPEAIAGARFMTSEHWRLHQLLPVELAAAVQPFADLVAAELDAAGLRSSWEPGRDAWILAKVVVAAFHDAAFRPDEVDMDAVADDVCHFCLAAVGARTTEVFDAS